MRTPGEAGMLERFTFEKGKTRGGTQRRQPEVSGKARFSAKRQAV